MVDIHYWAQLFYHFIIVAYYIYFLLDPIALKRVKSLFPSPAPVTLNFGILKREFVTGYMHTECVFCVYLHNLIHIFAE